MGFASRAPGSCARRIRGAASPPRGSLRYNHRSPAQPLDCSLPLDLAAPRGRERPARVQGVAKLVEGLAGVSCEERLRTLGLPSSERWKVSGDLMAR